MAFFTTFAKMKNNGKIASDREKYAPEVHAHFDQNNNVEFGVGNYNDDELGEWFTVQIQTNDYHKNPDGMKLTIYLNKEQLAQLGSVIAKEVNRHSIA